MTRLETVVIVTVLVAVLFVIGVNIPIGWLAIGKAAKFGNVNPTSISTATGLANFPAIYNANNTLLDAGKIDTGTTSVSSITTLSNLVTVGTITSGTWSGTAIAVAKGGTGTTSPTSNLVMLGNGSSGLKTVNGFGTSGMFLTSSGGAAAPTWTSASVDVAAAYSWSGNHNFTGSTYIKTLIASSTLVLNSVSLSFPATQGASSTLLATDGSGLISWFRPDFALLASTTLAAAAASTTLSSIPAATDLFIVIDTKTFSGNANNIHIQFNADTGTNYAWTASNLTALSNSNVGNTTVIRVYPAVGSSAFGGYVELHVTNPTLSTKKITGMSVEPNIGGMNFYAFGGLWNNSTAQISSITVGCGPANCPAGSRISVYGSNQ